jgi:hypothetical protein
VRSSTILHRPTYIFRVHGPIKAPFSTLPLKVDGTSLTPIENKINKIEAQIEKVNKEIDKYVERIESLEGKSGLSDDDRETLQSWRKEREALRAKEQQLIVTMNSLIVEKTELEKKLPDASSLSGRYSILFIRSFLLRASLDASFFHFSSSSLRKLYVRVPIVKNIKLSF